MDRVSDIVETFDSIVSEISVDPAGMVPLIPEIRERAVKSDENPLFGTYVIESGWSKSKRFWGPELFEKVAQEMQTAAHSEPFVGYLGHIRPEDDPYLFPDIQLQWLGAKLLSAGDKARLAVKAYFMPKSKAKDYAERGLARSVSWRGKVAQEMYQQGVRIKDFAIESIDLSRPRAAGMSARLVALTSEMENEGGNSVKPEEIAALQQNELRAHNPTLVTEIETGAKQPLETKVGEMQTEAAAVKPALDLIPSLRKVLGLDENADELSVIQAALTSISEHGKKLRDTVVDSVFAKRFKDKDATLLRRVVVGEMKDRKISLTGNEDADEKAVSEMITSIIDSDAKLKEIVSEMEDTAASPPSVSSRDKNGGTKPRDLKAGSETSTLRVRSVA